MIKQIENQFNLNISKLEDVPESFSSTVYKSTLEDGRVTYIKIPYSKLKFTRELAAYQLLDGQVAIPKLLDVWEGDDEVPGAFLLSALKGRPLSSSNSTRLAYNVGVHHAQLHTIRPNGIQGIDNEYPDWRAFVDRMFYSFAEDTKNQISSQQLEQSIKTYERMKQELPIADGPSFLHMDFRPANIIVDGDSVSGSIDFESVRFGATEMDFTKLYRDYLQQDPALFAAYQDGYRSVRPLIELDAVLPFYRFTDAFNSIGWCERRGIEKNRAFLNQNLQLLQDFLQLEER